MALKDVLHKLLKPIHKKHVSVFEFNRTNIQIFGQIHEALKDIGPAVAERIYEEVVPKTPYLTGRAQANWKISDRELDDNDYDKTAVQPDGQLNPQTFDRKAKVLYVDNKSPYVAALEDGSLSSKGSHMVRDAIKKVNNEFDGKFK